MPELPALEKAEKRERIIQAALKVFHQKGYNPVALEEIAREAGLAKGTLYLYFQDKDDLFASAIRHVIEVVQRSVIAAIDESREPLWILERMAHAQMEVFARNPNFFSLFFILSNPRLVRNRRELFCLVMESQEKFTAYLAELLEKAQAQGGIHPDLEPRAVAVLFGGMLSSAVHSLNVHSLNQKNVKGKPDIGRTVHTMMNVFRYGVTPRRESE